MTSYLANVWSYRYFWMSLVQLDLRTKYRGTVVGIGWSLMRPLAMTAILCLVFHKLLNVDPIQYGLYLMAGFACWNFLSGVTFDGCKSLFQAEPFIRQQRVPLVIYPLRTTLTTLVHFLIAFAVVLVASWTINRCANLASLISLIPGVFLLFVLGWSLATIAAFTNVYFRDTQHLSEVGFQLLFYATPVVYQVRILQENNLSWLLRINPLVSFLELIRRPILEGAVPSATTFLVATCTAVAMALLAILTLVRLQRDVIFRF